MKNILAFAIISCFAVFGICEEGQQNIENLLHNHASNNIQMHLKLRAVIPGYGPSLAIEMPFSNYFSLGAMLNTNFNFLRSGANFDVNMFAKARYPFQIGAYDAAAYLITPFGLSLFPQTGWDTGFNFSALPGFIFYFNKHWGVFAEVGYNMTIYPIRTEHRLEASLGATYAF